MSGKKITVYCVLSHTQLVKRMESLPNESFDVKFVDTFHMACDEMTNNGVIVIEKSMYNALPEKCMPEKCPARCSVIVVSDVQLNLHDSNVNKVPLELFLTPYLDEFIFWTVEKSKYFVDLIESEKRKERVESLITELHDLSRCSVLQME